VDLSSSYSITSPQFTIPHHSRSWSIPYSFTNFLRDFRQSHLQSISTLENRILADSLPPSAALPTSPACGNSLTSFPVDARVMVWHEKLASLFSHGLPTPKEEQVVLRGKRLRNLEEKRDMVARSKSGIL